MVYKLLLLSVLLSHCTGRFHISGKSINKCINASLRPVRRQIT